MSNPRTVRRPAASGVTPTTLAAPITVAIGIVLLLVSPVISLPGGAETHPLAKATIAAAGCGLILAGPRRNVLPRAVAVAVVGILSALAVSAVVNGSVGAAFSGSYPRYEGAWIISVYVAALVAGARVGAFANTARIRTWVLSAAAVLVAAAALLGVILNADQRVISALGNASELGLWAAMVAASLAPAALKRQPAAIVGCCLALLTVVLSASRGAFLACGVGAVVLVVLNFRKRVAVVTALGIGAVGIVALLIPATSARLLSDGAGASRTLSIRSELWADSWELFASHPVFGYGPSMFVDAMAGHTSDRLMGLVGGKYVIDSPHNLVLQVLISGGLVLAVAVVAFAWVWMRGVLQAARVDAIGISGATAAVAVFITGTMFHFTSPGTVPLAAFLAGWVVSLRFASSEDQEHIAERVQPRPAWEPKFADNTIRIVGGAWLMICALALAFATLAEVRAAQALEAAASGDGAQSFASWESAQALRPWDKDFVLRTSRAANWAVSEGLVAPTACLEPTLEALDTHPRSAEASGDRAKCLAYNADTPGALQVLREGLKTNPNDTELLVLQGRANLLEGNRVAAEAAYQRSLQIQPNNKEAVTGLREALER